MDGASMFFVMHHIPPEDWNDVFDEVERVVKKGGMLFLVEDTPANAEQARAVAGWDKRSNVEIGSVDDFHISDPQWRQILSERGYRIEDTKDFSTVDPVGKKEIPHTSYIIQLPK